MNIIDNISADTIEIGDHIIIDSDPVEVVEVFSTLEIHEVSLRAYSHNTGDYDLYLVHADDHFDVWTV